MSALHHWFLPHQSNNQRAKLLHPSVLATLIGCFVFFQILVGQFSYRYPHILGYASQIPPSEIIRLTNIERKNAGLSELQYDAQLSNAAAQKGADMMAKDYWAHVSPTGTQPWYFISQSGYGYRYAGENLARDFSEPNAVIQAWKDSPTHKENLMSNKYQDIGVAVIDGTLGGRETTLVVQMFGTKLSADSPPSLAQAGIAVKAAETTNVVPTKVPAAPLATVNPTEITTPMPTETIAPTPTSYPAVVASAAIVSPFKVTKLVSLVILGIIVAVLAIDVWLTSKRKIVRWTSKSFAHLAFMTFLIIAAVVVYSGQIL